MDITRSFIDTAVTKALRDIQRDPERSIRNLVDLGSSFSRGRFQKGFLATAQTMLKQQKSAYYDAAKRIVKNIDHTNLKTFGVNLGYNSLTRGARKIRELEAELGINIPWAIYFEYKEGGGFATAQDFDRLITAGKEHGIFTYCFTCDVAAVPAALGFPRRHRDAAFVLFAKPGQFTPALLEHLSTAANLMVCLDAEDAHFLTNAAQLRAHKLLYSASVYYDDSTAATARSEEMMQRVLQSEGVFFSWIAARECSQETRHAMYEHALAIRKGQEYPVFVIDFFEDMLYIDRVISEQACFLGVGATGLVYAPDADGIREDENILTSPLRDILCRAMPRATYL